MLELRNVRKLYSGIPAVDGVSFIVSPGEVTGYLGPNGSGKSTTLKMIAGLIEPSAGGIHFDGEPIQLHAVRYRQRFGYVPEQQYLYTHLTGGEYLTMVGELRGLADDLLERKIETLLTLFSLREDRHVPISSYSKGMRQKILISAALLHNPDLIILDEPFSGLDVNTALVLRDVIQGLAARGKMVLLSSHELDTVERVCSKVIILSKGHVVANDSVQRLRTLMAQPSLEAVFSQLAIDQDTAAISREIVETIEA